MFDFKKRFLRAQLQSLSERDFISCAQKEAIFDALNLNRLNSKSASFSLLSVFAFIFIALGLLLLVAFNWQSFGTPLKTGFLLALLLSAHLGVLYFKDKNPALAAGLGILSNFILLANLALLSQIYHLGGNAPLALFSVSVASLVLAFALGSFAIFIQAYLFYFAGFILGLESSVFYGSFGAFILLAFGLGVFYESAFLRFLNFIFLVLYTLYSPLFMGFSYDFGAFLNALVFLSFIFLSLNFSAYRGYFAFALSLAFLLSSAQIAAANLFFVAHFSYFWLFLGALLIFLNFYKKRYFLGALFIFIALLPLIFDALHFKDFQAYTLTLALIYSLLSLFFSIYLFKKGYKVLALLSLCALAFVRYFDLIGDYLGAGVVFVVFGVILLICSLVLKRQENCAQTPKFKADLEHKGGQNEK